MAESQVDVTRRGSKLGYALIVIGAIMTAGVVIKMAVGFYTHELPVLIVIAAAGAALAWLGEKLTD